MLNQNVPPPTVVGEITAQDLKRQEWEVQTCHGTSLTRSNWRFFYAMQTSESPQPGTDRRDDDQPKS